MTTLVTRTFIVAALACFFASHATALSTDRQQPAVISADDVEFDFATGVRIYRGNVQLDQGSMKLRADKLIVEYKNDVLQRATAFGNPAVFQQRPDGKPKDMIGRGRKLELDEVKNIVTITENAFIDNGDGTATGSIITYDITKDKMKIIGATLQQEAKEKTPVKKENGRSKITISAEERQKAQQANSE